MKKYTLTSLPNWNGWRLDAREAMLLTPEDCVVEYEIDLNQCKNPAEVLDWIAQMKHKTWVDDSLLAGLVRALDDILDMQANLCSCGNAKELSGSDIEFLVSPFRRSS